MLPLTTFASLPLAKPLLRALEEQGYHTPTPIQAQAITPIAEGRDLLGCAQTGTGKTAAFALPILHRLLTAPGDKGGRGPKKTRALILSPTRELATQIGESFADYGRHSGMRGTCIYGGVKQSRQERALRGGVDIIVATPGRLMDLMEQGLVDLSGVEVLVLDEADRMLDMGFIAPIRTIASALPATRQTLLFSATMPREIVKLAESLLRDPVRVSVTPTSSTVELITQSVYMVSKHQKQALLEHLLEDRAIDRAIVFTRTKHGADRVSRKLKAAGVSSDSIHGNKTQGQRQRALDRFRGGQARVLVATDVAARGLDVDAISHVFNFDLPKEPEAYVHRIGRTGRAGATGIAIGFCDTDERGYLRSIEKLTGQKVPAITQLPKLPEPAPRTAEEMREDRDERPDRRPAPPRGGRRASGGAAGGFGGGGYPSFAPGGEGDSGPKRRPHGAKPTPGHHGPKRRPTKATPNKGGTPGASRRTGRGVSRPKA